MVANIIRIEVHVVIFSKEEGESAVSETEIANIIDGALSEAKVAYALPSLINSKKISKGEFEQEADRDYDEIFTKEDE